MNNEIIYNKDFFYNDETNFSIEIIESAIKNNKLKKIREYIIWQYNVSPEIKKEYEDLSLYFILNVNFKIRNNFPFDFDITGFMQVNSNSESSINITILSKTRNILTKSFDKIKPVLANTISHEIHHLTQSGALSSCQEYKHGRTSYDNKFEYFSDIYEVPAFVIGFRAESNYSNKNVEDCMYDYLSNYLSSNRITEGELKSVLDRWLSCDI